MWGGGGLTNVATPVTNGLFTVTLDFGSGVFDGNARWLDIGVRTNGGGAFTSLSPRQPILPTPYALYAANAGIAAAGTVASATTAATATNAQNIVLANGTVIGSNVPYQTNITPILDYTRIWVTNTGIAGEDGMMHTNVTLGGYTNLAGFGMQIVNYGGLTIGIGSLSALISGNPDYDSNRTTNWSNLQNFCCSSWAFDNGSSPTVLTYFPTNSITTNILNMYVLNGTATNANNLPWYQNVMTAGVGIMNDGVTDVTTPLQALLNSGGSFYFPPGKYLAKELYLTNNTSLLGLGATLVYSTNAACTNIFVTCGLNTNISISGLAFDGGNYSNIYSRTFNTYLGAQTFANPSQFLYWNPLGLRHGLQVNIIGQGRFNNIKIIGFSGCGFIPVSSMDNLSYTEVHAQIDGIDCFSNFCGFWSSSLAGRGDGYYNVNWLNHYINTLGYLSPEYQTYSHLNLNGNTIGLNNVAGNDAFVCSVIANNYIGELDSYGVNEHHGLINSVLYNHNMSGSLLVYGSTAGEQIINCQFRGGGGGQGITLNSCQGWSIDNCAFDSLCFTNTAGSPVQQNFFRNNVYWGVWTNLSFSTDGNLIYYGNVCATNKYDNDGQPLTLAAIGNGSGLINLSANAIVGGFTANLTVLVPGGGTNTLCFTNGVLRAIQ